MSKISPVQNGDSGLVSRTKMNEAVKLVRDTVNTSVAVSPATAYTDYFVDATLATVNIELPNATVGNTDDMFFVVLDINTNPTCVTTVGGVQLIGGEVEQFISNVRGRLILKSNGTGYDIVADTRTNIKIIDITANVILDSLEAGAVYRIIAGVGQNFTVEIPNSTTATVGEFATFLLKGEGSCEILSLIPVPQPIGGAESQIIATDNTSILLVDEGSGYEVLQDSRPKAGASGIFFYPLDEVAGVAGYLEMSNTQSDARFNPAVETNVGSTSIAVVDTLMEEFVGDQGAIQGSLGETPVSVTLQAKIISGSQAIFMYCEFYHRTSGGTETLLATSNISTLITADARLTINAVMSPEDFGATDSLVMKLFASPSGGGSTATAALGVEGADPTLFSVSVPEGSVPHDNLPGLSFAAAGVTYGHVNDVAQTIEGQKSFLKAINEAKGSDIASATTTDIGASTGNYVDVTGTTTITALGTVTAGARRVVTFDGILILTHNATSLILPTGASITTQAGDTGTFISLGSGNWKCTDYLRADGTALASAGGGATDIDGLSDGITGGGSVFLGTDSGIVDDLVNNNNVGVGISSLKANTTGVSNVAVGNSALISNIGGGNNVAVGKQALLDNTSGNQNVAIAVNALANNTDGDRNIGIGHNSLQGIISGSEENTAIGYNAAFLQTAGLRNIAIGSNVALASLTGSDQVNIGDVFRGDRATGNVGIGGVNSTTSILNVTGLPTSAAGLATGDVWNNSGVLTIV